MWGQSNSLPHRVIPAGTSVLLGPVSCPAEVGLGRAVAVTVALCAVLRRPRGKGHSSFLREAAVSGMNIASQNLPWPVSSSQRYCGCSDKSGK